MVCSKKLVAWQRRKAWIFHNTMKTTTAMWTLSTLSMQVMEKVPDTIVVFNAGEKIAEGTYQEIINDQDVIDAYIGGGDEDE